MTLIGQKPPDGPSDNPPDERLAPTRLVEIDVRGNVVYPFGDKGEVIDQYTGHQIPEMPSDQGFSHSLKLHMGDALNEAGIHKKYPDAPDFKALKQLKKLLNKDGANELAKRRLVQLRQEAMASLDKWSRRVAEAIEEYEYADDSDYGDDRVMRFSPQEVDERKLRPEERKFYDYMRIMRPAMDLNMPELKYPVLELTAHIVERLWNERASSELVDHARVIAKECVRAIVEDAVMPEQKKIRMEMACLLSRVIRALPMYEREEPIVTAAAVLRESMVPDDPACITAIFHYKQLSNWFSALDEYDLRYEEIANSLETLLPLTAHESVAISDAAAGTLDFLRGTYPALVRRVERQRREAAYVYQPERNTESTDGNLAKVFPISDAMTGSGALNPAPPAVGAGFSTMGVVLQFFPKLVR